MKIYQIIKAAEEMGVERSFAIKCRHRYITSRIPAIDAELSILKEWVERHDVNAAFVSKDFCQLLIEKCSLLRERHAMKSILDTRKQDVTDDMIESARNVPIEQVVDFSRKKATAWCHEDRRPSLCHMTRINKAWCPVCGNYFGPIDVLMSRDGMTFRDAVKSLS